MKNIIGTAARYFLVVARTGSVTHAAEQLHVAVSAVSRQIAKLETNIGCPLFERHARGMVLSEAGERLAAHVRVAAQEAERVIEEVRGLGGVSARLLRVACTEGLGPGFMAEVMTSFRAANPQATFHLQIDTPEGISRSVILGDVDIGVKFAAAPERGLCVDYDLASPIVALVAPDHPLAGREMISLEDIVSHPLALPEDEKTVRQIFNQSCALKGLRYRPTYVANYATLLSLAANAGMLSLSFGVSAHSFVQSGAIVRVPVDDEGFQNRRLLVLTLEGRVLPSYVVAFREHLVGCLAEYE